MSDRLLNRLLGSGKRDPGCEAGFEVLDEYADAVLRGLDTERLYPEVIAHIASCDACREDTEGLIAALRAANFPEESR